MNKDNKQVTRVKELIFVSFLFLIFILPDAGLYAQFTPSKVKRSNNIIELDGQKYYLHEVKEKQTLYSISKTYNVSVKVIAQENPAVLYGDIREGQVLKIPFAEVVEPLDEALKDHNLYIYHIVEPKQTLSAISRKYGIPVQTIIRLNEGVEDVLPVGKEIRIPRTQVSQTERDIIPQNDEHFKYHEVKPQETLFALSRAYNVKVKDIKDANPGLRWGLTIGEIIRIPLDPDYIADQATKDSQNMGVTLSDLGIADNKTHSTETGKNYDSTAVPEDCAGIITPHSDNLFEIAFLLPLFLNDVDNLQLRDTLTDSGEVLNTESFRFVEFLEGALMAIDSLRQAGLTMNVHIYDTERDPAVVAKIIQDGKLEGMHMIIGPVYPETLEIVSAYSKNNQIPMVSPLSSRGIGIDNNPFLFQVNPPVQLQQDLASIFLSKFYSKNILLVVDPGDQSNQTTRYSSRIKNYLTYKINPSDLRYRHIAFSDEQRAVSLEDSMAFRLEDVLSLHSENLIIIPSTDKVFVSDMINRLNNLSLHYKITVFGRPEWGHFDALQLESLFKLNLHYYTNFSNPYVDYTDSTTLAFCKKFRQNFNNEPGRFSFQGFDVTYYFIKSLYLFGENLTDYTFCWPVVLQHQTLQTEFHFVRNNESGGFENQALSIVRYNQQSLEKEKISSTSVMSQVWQP